MAILAAARRRRPTVTASHANAPRASRGRGGRGIERWVNVTTGAARYASSTATCSSISPTSSATVAASKAKRAGGREELRQGAGAAEGEGAAVGGNGAGLVALGVAPNLEGAELGDPALDVGVSILTPPVGEVQRPKTSVNLPSRACLANRWPRHRPRFRLNPASPR